MNIYHRYLNLPFKIAKYPLFDTTPTQIKHLDINPYRDPQIDKFHQYLGLSIIHTEVFWTPAGASLPIHADGTTLDNRVKINITWGPEEGIMRWWQSHNTFVMDISKTKEILKKDNNLPNTLQDFTHREHTNVLAKREDCTMVHQANTNRVSLVNVGQLHDTYSPSHAGRWTLCFVPVKSDTDKYISWNTAMEVYKDYLE